MIHLGSLPYGRLPFSMQFRFSALLLVLSCIVPTLSAAPHPNVVLITLDTTRADRMGFLGSKAGLTPNLDELALQGVVFTRAYAHVPLTTASHATILTGTYPQYNHVNDFWCSFAASPARILPGLCTRRNLPDRRPRRISPILFDPAQRDRPRLRSWIRHLLGAAGWRPNGGP